MGIRLKQFRARVAESRLVAGLGSSIMYLLTWYWPRLRVRWSRLPEFAVPIWLRGEGAKVSVLVRTNGADSCVFRGVFLDKEYQHPDLPPRPRTILDVGGNCGFASVFFGLRYPEADIVAIEPLPKNAAAWTMNVRRSRCRARLVEAALGCEDGQATFYLTGNDSCESLSPIHQWHDRMQVETVSMLTLLEKLGWETVDLLKLDIEGYERELLKGSPRWLARMGCIAAELHGGYTSEDFAKDLAPFGFVVQPLSTAYEKTYLARRLGPQ